MHVPLNPTSEVNINNIFWDYEWYANFKDREDGKLANVRCFKKYNDIIVKSLTNNCNKNLGVFLNYFDLSAKFSTTKLLKDE